MEEPLINKGQIGRIWGIAKKGLQLSDDDLYRMIHEHSGQTEMTRMTYKQAQSFIGHLVGLSNKVNRNSLLKAKSRGVESLSSYRRTAEQDEILEVLLQKVNGAYPKLQLDHLAQRMWHKPAAKLNRREAQSVIEALKSMCQRNNVEVK